ncbi:hypothetical protein BTA51_19050 [Hahella sp. CCB-MM4]|uniref:vWA domain-containing protein n=1 Tax=Hahella sp. (strain CCB-MM4) TaxID=1926491 RepID=UPI000B9A5760|nr:VWA domain-containing protein [Hahella sp. CCB-MM4]OZG71740.1 hypothetical protein BTA51_19050 [Hahella sp. CCB-MM4]
MRSTLFCLCIFTIGLSACSAPYVYQNYPGNNEAFAPQDTDSQDKFIALPKNNIKLTKREPVSTFSIDVDTGSYSIARRMLSMGNLPPPEAVRVEEFINYFDYDYLPPQSSKVPFSVSTEIGPTPWDQNTQLLQIGIKGYEVPPEEVGNSNLVFLIDVSGSMQGEDRLDLVKQALTSLTYQLRPDDQISIVVYAGAAGVILPPTFAYQKSRIIEALDQLEAGGSTNGGEGIQLAYSLAQKAYIEGGINRIILCTDGDLNVGITDTNQLKSLVEANRERGISLTTLGFGLGNYNDHLMEQLADIGNGNYAYIDNYSEARRVLVDQANSTLMTIAKDVKIQIEFNPEVVNEYRLIGYENRLLNRADFNNDKVDAGDIGAGHTVTAIYEIRLSDSDNPSIDPLRYQTAHPTNERQNDHGELAYLKLRYKLPDGDHSQLVKHPILTQDIKNKLYDMSDDFRFSAAVAAFGQKLGHSQIADMPYASIHALASGALGQDKFGYRREFMSLIKSAETLSQQQSSL